jgi:hypothetical protein
MVGMLARPAPAVVVVLLRVAWVGCDMGAIENFRTGFTVDPRELEREVARKLARHELYDELDADNKAETKLFELLVEDDTDENAKRIGHLVWSVYARLVKREIDTMNEQIAEQSVRDRMEV